MPDRLVVVDDVARNMGGSYYGAFDRLLEAEARSDSGARCRDDQRMLLVAVPPDRVNMSAPDAAKFRNRCPAR